MAVALGAPADQAFYEACAASPEQAAELEFEARCARREQAALEKFRSMA